MHTRQNAIIRWPVVLIAAFAMTGGASAQSALPPVASAVSKAEIARTLEGINYDRTGGREGERRAVEFLETRLREYGVAFTRHDVRAWLSWPVSASLRTTGPPARTFAGITVVFGGSTGPAGVTAPVHWLHDDGLAVKVGDDVRGKIVVHGSGVGLEDSVLAAQRAGAVGIVRISNNDTLHEDTSTSVWGTPTTASAARVPRIPIISITRRDGESLRELVQASPSLEVTLTAQVDRAWTSIPLVVAEVPGELPDFVLVATHIDAWYAGMTDTGGTVASILEMARVLKREGRLRRGVRFAWWPGHSFGRYAGSAWYVDHFWAELDRYCVAYTNLDGAGRRGSRVNEVVAGGWPGIAEFSRRFAETRLGRQPTPSSDALFRPGRNSDSAFQGLGIPEFFVGVPGPPMGHPDVEPDGTITYWHTKDDTLDKIDLEALTLDTAYRLAQIHELAASPAIPLTLAPIAASYRRAVSALAPLVDLSVVANAVTRLERLAERVDALPRPASDATAQLALDRMLVRLTHRLNSMLYTGEGRFDQDPAADLPILPRLARARELSTLGRDTDARIFLETELLRGRNGLVATLDDASDELERYLQTIDGGRR